MGHGLAEAAHMIDTGGQGRWAAAVLACLVSLWPAFAAGAADETPVRWDVESLARVVKPDEKYRFPMSQDVYRELVRHV
jgi:hypothetical protein